MKGQLKWIVLLLPLLLAGGYVAGSVSTAGGARLPFVTGGIVTGGNAAERSGSEREHEPARRVTLPTKERVVTLADAQVLRYLKTQVVLEFEPPKHGGPPKGEEYKKVQEELGKELSPVMPAIEDVITTVVASRTASDVTSPSGKDRLKAALIEHLNRLPLERHVTNVYFTQFIIQ